MNTKKPAVSIQQPSPSPLPWEESMWRAYRMVDATGNPLAEFYDQESLYLAMRRVNQGPARDSALDEIVRLLGPLEVQGVGGTAVYKALKLAQEARWSNEKTSGVGGHDD